jgi:ribosomal protein L37AE/L43A
MLNQKDIRMDTQNKNHKIICHDCGGNGYRKDCYGEVYQCKECNVHMTGEIVGCLGPFTEEEMLENIDDAME